jgi:hypothetical protein
MKKPLSSPDVVTGVGLPERSQDVTNLEAEKSGKGGSDRRKRGVRPNYISAMLT